MSLKLYEDLKIGNNKVRNEFSESMAEGRTLQQTLNILMRNIKNEKHYNPKEKFLKEAKYTALLDCSKNLVNSRSFFSKLFHPFRTYQESKALKTLEKVLGSSIEGKKTTKTYKRDLKKEAKDDYKEKRKNGDLDAKYEGSIVDSYKFKTTEIHGGMHGLEISEESREMYLKIEKGEYNPDGTLLDSNKNPYIDCLKNCSASELTKEEAKDLEQVNKPLEPARVQEPIPAEDIDDLDDEKSYIDLPTKEDELEEGLELD